MNAAATDRIVTVEGRQYRVLAETRTEDQKHLGNYYLHATANGIVSSMIVVPAKRGGRQYLACERSSGRVYITAPMPR